MVCPVDNAVLKNLLIIGGTGRNVGKTEFVCRLIGKISCSAEVFALKVSAVYPDEEIFHGDHGKDEASGRLTEEFRRNGDKDTIRMLKAGARRVFYLRSDGVGIKEGFRDFLRMVPEHAAIVCESNSLADAVKPAALIMVKGAGGEVKRRAVSQLERADLVIVSDGKSGFQEVQLVDFDPVSGWQLLK